MVIHLAAVVGGIGANREHPGSFFYQNAIMGIQLMEEARLAGVERFLTVGTVCSYPKFTPVPFREETLWDGYPEETNAPYGLAKKMLLVQSQAYRDEYGFDAVYVIPVNLYGPGDNFDPASSHVIPALIRKVVDAHDRGDPEVPVWGTGLGVARVPVRRRRRPGRGARGRALDSAGAGEPGRRPRDHHPGARRTHLRAGRATRAALAWDATKPDGQPRRALDTSRAREAFGFTARMPFEEGLRRTIDWWRLHRSTDGRVDGRVTSACCTRPRRSRGETPRPVLGSPTLEPASITIDPDRCITAADYARRSGSRWQCGPTRRGRRRTIRPAGSAAGEADLRGRDPEARAGGRVSCWLDEGIVVNLFGLVVSREGDA